MPKEILFKIKKSDSNLLRYYVIDVPRPNFETVEGLDDFIKNHNEGEGKTTTIFRVTNAHTIEAILQKESFQTIRGRVESVRDDLKQLGNQIDDLRREIDSLDEFIREKIEEE